MNQTIIWQPSEFVAVFNQTLELAYPLVHIEGEINNFRLSKGKWIFFDIKDELSSIRCFGYYGNLRLPVEDGMLVRLVSSPELHNLYGFSLKIIDLMPIGEGSIKQSADLLKRKLESEGLFLVDRKRPMPQIPKKIGLITSSEAAAYGDFVKIVNDRWPLVEIDFIDTKVQGDQSAEEIINALERFNFSADVDVIVITRGGGASSDLLTFQEEKLVRAIASSRIPTLVAIGHERDYSLAELVADARASTPSNAAEIITPSQSQIISSYYSSLDSIKLMLQQRLGYFHRDVVSISKIIRQKVEHLIDVKEMSLAELSLLIEAYNPKQILKRGYTTVRFRNKYLKSKNSIKRGDRLTISFYDGDIQVDVIGLDK